MRGSSERQRGETPRVRTAAVLGVLFGLLLCVVLAASLWLLGTLLQRVG
jgi:hypothetical protein